MNSQKITLILSFLFAVGSTAPQNNPDTDQRVEAAFQLVPEIMDAFSDIPNQGSIPSDFSQTSPEESERVLTSLLDVSMRTLEASERSGIDVPATIKERLSSAQAIIPATFKFLKQLRNLGEAGNFNDFQFGQRT
ncbi:hypothetical protein SK128_013395 [Halocaridina rubra]|uniref:Uncharacterized protein n=1 Tax=Halocaridina rubra TaxID=373956 RepID=A0AAN8X6V1_HALRR